MRTRKDRGNSADVLWIIHASEDQVTLHTGDHIGRLERRTLRILYIDSTYNF